MASIHPVRRFLLSCALLALLPAAASTAQLDEPTYDENVYVNCQYRFAAIFPRAQTPAVRDFTYRSAGRSGPARQFHIQNGADLFSVIVVNFADGPPVDENLMMAATLPILKRGVARQQFMEPYDPGIPGRQLNIFEPNGRQRRASVYMWDHRLYITEADSVPGDFAALQFEQSVSIINAAGTDLDKNGALPSRQYNCRK